LGKKTLGDARNYFTLEQVKRNLESNGAAYPKQITKIKRGKAKLKLLSAKKKK